MVGIVTNWNDAIFDIQPSMSGSSIVRTFDPFIGIEVAASATIIEQPIIIELSITGQTFIGLDCTCGPDFNEYNNMLTLEFLLVPLNHPCCPICPQASVQVTSVSPTGKKEPEY